MADQTAASAPVPATSGPSHYAVRLARSFAIQGTTVIIPAGDSTVIASVVDTMPPEIIVSKTPAAA